MNGAEQSAVRQYLCYLEDFLDSGDMAKASRMADRILEIIFPRRWRK